MNTARLGDIVSFKTGKLNSNAATPDGEYPFFTCSQETYRTNTYSFDTECVLLGGNNASGIYPLKYFSGKFDAYQRTYVIRSIDGENLINRYLYYALRLQLELMKSISTGATTKFLTLTILRDIEILLPSMSSQNKIASILSAYDDLIENNLKRIKILEEMAQMIYREWLVNFRFPGHEKVRMVDSPLGKTPEGWEVKLLRELVSYYIGGGWGKEEKDDNHIADAFVIRGTDMPNARQGVTTGCPCRFHKASNLKSRKLLPNDIILEVSGGSKGQPVGRNILVDEELLSQFSLPAMCASFCKLVRINDSFSPYYIDQYIRDIYESGEILKYQTQSTGISNFKFEFFLDDVKIAIPSNEVLDEFDTILGDMYQSIYKLGKRNTNLRKTRDLLLPKLISGELDVGKLEINNIQ